MCHQRKPGPETPKEGQWRGHLEAGVGVVARLCNLHSGLGDGRRQGPWRIPPRLSVARHSFLCVARVQSLTESVPQEKPGLGPGRVPFPSQDAPRDFWRSTRPRRRPRRMCLVLDSAKLLRQHLECRPLTGGRPDSMLHLNALQPRYSAEPRGPAAPFPGANHEPLKTPARPCLSPPRPPSRPPSAPEWWGLGRSSSLVTLGGWIVKRYERKGGHDAYQDEASDELPESSPSLLFFTMINRAVW